MMKMEYMGSICKCVQISACSLVCRTLEKETIWMEDQNKPFLFDLVFKSKLVVTLRKITKKATWLTL